MGSEPVPEGRSEQTRAALLAARENGRSIVITGATVLTMDPGLGDFERADVLIEGAKIGAVAPQLEDARTNPESLIVDASGLILLPGLVDTHRHCWQTQFRRLIPDVEDVAAYLAATHEQLAPHYTPEDIYVGNYLGALGALDAGITCLLDFSHNTRSEEHADAAIRAYQDAGLRVVYACGPPLAGEWEGQWPRDLVRLQEAYFRSRDQLLTLRLAVLASDALAGESVALTEERLRFAREIGVQVSADGLLGPRAAENVERLGAAGLLGPDVTLIHCNGIREETWRHIAASGAEVSLTPTSDAQIGLGAGIPPIQAALDHGIRPGRPRPRDPS